VSLKELIVNIRIILVREMVCRIELERVRCSDLSCTKVLQGSRQPTSVYGVIQARGEQNNSDTWRVLN